MSQTLFCNIHSETLMKMSKGHFLVNASKSVRHPMMLEKETLVTVLGRYEGAFGDHFSNSFRRSRTKSVLIMVCGIEISVVGFVEDYCVEDRTGGYCSQLHSEVFRGC